MKSNQKILILLLWLLVVLGVIIGWMIKTQWEKRPSRNEAVVQKPVAPRSPRPAWPEKQPSARKFTPVKELSGGERPIMMHRPHDLSRFSKEEVFKHRIEAVKNSIFDAENYTPSEEVFGQIVSYKPWVTTSVCRMPPTFPTDGPSEEDRFIGNPTILVAVEYPFAFSQFDPAYCRDDMFNLIPQSVGYNPELKEITVVYKKFPYPTRTKNKYAFYTFNGINARDLGYAFAYVDPAKSTLDVAFSQPDNISTQVIEFQNFIHVGGSCGVSGGCNNGSPRQGFLEFHFDPAEKPEQSKEFFVKLWKEKPSSVNDPADLTERIIVAEP